MACALLGVKSATYALHAFRSWHEGLEFLNRPENVTPSNEASNEQKFNQLMELLKGYKKYEARKKAKRKQSDGS